MALDLTTEHEAIQLARCLIGDHPRDVEVERYRRAIEIRGVALETPRDRRLWVLAMRGPGWMAIVDAGLAWSDAYSPVRHRIGVMLAVLETSPAHCRRFLPSDYPRSALFGLAARMAGAAFRIMLGAILVRTHGVLWR